MIDVTKLRPDMHRDDVIAMFGEPDATGGTSRKYPTPSVFKYGNIELYFFPWKSGELIWAQDDDKCILYHRSRRIRPDQPAEETRA